MSTTQLETRNSKLETDLKDLAQDIVRRAMSGGATAAECVIREGDEFSTVVRLGQVETLKESGSKAVGVRVFYGKRAASTYSSDFSRAGIDRMLSSALELAKITSEDPYAGIPDPSQFGSLPRGVPPKATRHSRRRALGCLDGRRAGSCIRGSQGKAGLDRPSDHRARYSAATPAPRPCARASARPARRGEASGRCRRSRPDDRRESVDSR